MIVFNGVSKVFGENSVLENVSFTIAPGEFLCVTGPSGSGKTMLFSLLLGADAPSNGTISMDDVDLRNIPEAALRLFRQKVGVVWQDRKLLSTATVSENIAFPLEVTGASDDTIHQRTHALIKRLGLGLRTHALPSQLSNAEKTLAALLRAVAHKPMILLLDEPTMHLNAEQTRDVLDFIRELHASGMTVVVATVNTALAESLRTRVVRLEKGKIVSDTAASNQNVREVAEAVKKAVVKEKREEMPVLEAAAPMRKKVKVTAIHSD